MVCLLCFHFFQPNSVAAKLLEAKNRRASDSAEFYHRTGSGGKDKATDVSTRTTHYGVPQVPAKTPIINALPLSNQRKQPAASNFYQTIKGERNNISTINGFSRQGLSHRPSVLPAARGLYHHSRVNSQRIRRHSETTHRHLLQVSLVSTYLPSCMLYWWSYKIPFSHNLCAEVCLDLFCLQWFVLTENMWLMWDNWCFCLSHFGINLSSGVQGGNHDTKLKEWMKERHRPYVGRYMIKWFSLGQHRCGKGLVMKGVKTGGEWTETLKGL